MLTSPQGAPDSTDPTISSGAEEISSPPNDYRPEMLIPFRYSQEDAINACREYYKDKWLLPGILRDEEHYKEMQGGFVPYLLYTGKAEMDITYSAQDSLPVTGEDKIVKQLRDFEVRRKASAEYRRVQVNASKDVPEAFMHNLEPFRYRDLVPVEESADAELLEGLDSIRIEENADITRQRISESLKDAVKDTVKHNFVQEQSAEISLSHDKVECVLFPMWILISKAGRKYYHFAMNGQTGQIAGDLPFATWKAFLVFFGPLLGIAGAGFGIVQLLAFLMGRPSSTLMSVSYIVVLLVAMYVANNISHDFFEKLRKGRPKPTQEKRYDSRSVNLTYQEDKLLRKQFVNKKNVVLREEDFTIKK